MNDIADQQDPEDDFVIDDAVARLIADYRKRIESGEELSLENFAEQYPYQRESLLKHLRLERENEPGPNLISAGEADTHSIAAPSAESRERTHDYSPAVENNRSLEERQVVRKIGEYEILETIGRGGMGVVYKARQPKLDRVVALKTLIGPSEVDARQIQRFMEEAESMAKLEHPGIVQVFDVGESNGTHFFTMAFIEGESLSGRIQRSPLTPSEAVAIVAEAAEILEFAHRRGVIHRDIKPGNIFLDVTGRPHISDFGLAKRIDSERELTLTGQVLGTPGYMPPEQARGTEEVGPLADIYALGAVLFVALTGRAPFQAATPIETLRQVIDNEPPSLRTLNNNLPQDLETICRKCLEKKPAKRFQSAQELAEELTRFRQGVPIRSRPVSRMERTWRWCRRNPQLATSLALLFIVLVAGTTVSTIFGFQSAAFGKRNANLADERKLLLDDLQKRNIELAAEKSNVETQKKKAETNAKLAESRADELARKYYYSGLSRAWDGMSRFQGNLTRGLLDQLRPKPGEPDFRELVWHDLHRQLNSFEWEQESLREKVIPVPKSSLYVLKYRGSYNGFDVFDEANQSKMSFRFSPGSKLAFSPDGETVVGLKTPNFIRVFKLSDPENFRDVQLPVSFFRPGDALFSQLRFGNDPNHVLLSHYPKSGDVKSKHEISLINIETAEPLRSWSASEFEFDVLEGRLAFVGSTNGTRGTSLNVVNLEMDEETSVALDRKVARYPQVLVRWMTPQRIAVAKEKSLRLFSVSKSGLRQVADVELPEMIKQLEYNAKLDQLLVRVGHGHLLVLHPYSAKLLGQIPCADSSQYTFAVSRDELGILVADGQKIRRWKLNPRWPGNNSFEHIRASDKGTVAWKKNGSRSTNLVWFPAESGKVKRWTLFREIRSLEMIPGSTRAIAVSSFADIPANSTLEIIDLESGKTEFVSDDIPLNVEHVQVGIDGRTFMTINRPLPAILAGAPTGPLQVRDLASGKIRLEIDKKISTAKYSHDGKGIFTVSVPNSSGDTVFAVCDATTGKLIWEQPSSNRADRVNCFAEDSMGQRIALGMSGKKTRILDASSFEILEELTSNEAIHDVKFVGPALLVNENNRTIRHRDYVSGESVFQYRLPSGSANEDQRFHWDSKRGFLRVEPFGLEISRDGFLQNHASADAKDTSEIRNLLPVEDLTSAAAEKEFETLLNQSRKMMDDPRSSFDFKLGEMRRIQRRLKRLFHGREEQVALLNRYAVFNYWLADFVASSTETEEERLLSVAENPRVAFDRAFHFWRSVYDRSPNARARIMMGGVLNNKAMYHTRRENLTGAMLDLNAAVMIQKQVLQKEPKNRTAQSFLTNHYVNLLKATAASGQYDKLFTPIDEMLTFSKSSRLVDSAFVAILAAFEAADELPKGRREVRLDELCQKFKPILGKIPNGFASFKQHESFNTIRRILGDRLNSLQEPESKVGND